MLAYIFSADIFRLRNCKELFEIYFFINSLVWEQHLDFAFAQNIFSIIIVYYSIAFKYISNIIFRHTAGS